jgi:hypothetical protein
MINEVFFDREEKLQAHLNAEVKTAVENGFGYRSLLSNVDESSRTDSEIVGRECQAFFLNLLLGCRVRLRRACSSELLKRTKRKHA